MKTLLLLLLLLLAVAGISTITLIFVKTIKAIKVKKLSGRKIGIIAIVVVVAAVGITLFARRVYFVGPDITGIVDSSTKETQYTDIKRAFTLDSLFGSASVSDSSVYLTKFRYAGSAFASNAYLNIEKADGRQFVDRISAYSRMNYADSQKLVKHFDETYPSSYRINTENQEGYIHYDSFFEQTVKEITYICSLDASESIQNVSDLSRSLQKGNYVILDIVEEKIFGESYYDCHLEWCFSNKTKWQNSIWSSDHPVLAYLSELTSNK